MTCSSGAGNPSHGSRALLPGSHAAVSPGTRPGVAAAATAAATATAIAGINIARERGEGRPASATSRRAGGEAVYRALPAIARFPFGGRCHSGSDSRYSGSGGRSERGQPQPRATHRYNDRPHNSRASALPPQGTGLPHITHQLHAFAPHGLLPSVPVYPWPDPSLPVRN